MKRSVQIKLAIIVAAVLWSLYSLWPTFQLARGGAGMDAERRASLEDRSIRRGLDLAGGMYLVLEVNEDQLKESEISEGEALDRVITIIRNRIDEFGVSEPDIRKEGDARVVVQLPGLQDAERAKRLIGRTARLEFRLVREGNEVVNLVQRIDRVLAGAESPAATDSAGADLFAAADDSTALPADLDPTRPLTSLIGPFMEGFGAIPVAEVNRARVESLLARREVQRVVPRGLEFLWGVEELSAQGGGKAFLLYLVERSVSIAGDDISTAVVTADPDRPPQLMVSLTLTKRGGLRFSNVTGSNVGRKLAIVLDEKVHSAPSIRQKISGGRASISGGFATDDEARDLALMLRAGALPADVQIAEERTVGPSLGMDSIKQGIRSVWVSLIIIVIFIIIYYQAAGLLATAGLAMTLLLLMAVLAQFGLVLTLPGIAGIILTVGMAVDANVIIFERIREEIRAGKSVRAAIDAGYHQATRAIVDANVTTFIAALVLFYFGTGPIKGFAVTLSVGVATSMFSALVFTRTIYDLWLGNRQPERMSI